MRVKIGQMPKKLSRATALGLVISATTFTLVLFASWVPIAVNDVRQADLPTDATAADFSMFYGASELAREGRWSSVYSPVELSQHLRGTDSGASFAYPPLFPQLLGVMTAATLEFAAAAWIILSLLVFLALIPSLLGRDALFYTAALAFPVYSNLRLGQAGAVAALLMTLSLFSLRQKQPTWSGVWLAGLIFKPQMLAGPAVLAVSRRLDSRLVRSLTVGVIGLVTLSVLGGVDGWAAYLAGFLDSAQPGNVRSSWDYSLFGWMQSLFTTPEVSLALTIAISLVVIGFAIRQFRVVAFGPEILALGMVLTVVLSPRMVVYDWSILIAPLAILSPSRSGTTAGWASIALIVLASVSGIWDSTILQISGFAWLSITGAFFLLLHEHTKKSPAIQLQRTTTGSP